MKRTTVIASPPTVIASAAKQSSQKLLNGTELASYIKQRQARELRRPFDSSDFGQSAFPGENVDFFVANSKKKSHFPEKNVRPGGQNLKNRNRPQLAIIRDNDSPVIAKYVALKKQYGADIGVEVTDHLVPTDELERTIKEANADPAVTGIILQLPLLSPDQTDPLINQIAPEKDVDGLSAKSHFTSATALAIHHLLAGYNIDLRKPKIAIIGKGRLVGMPLAKMWQDSGYNITVFDSKSSLSSLNTFDVIVTATGHPNLIKPEMIGHSAILVDAGTASESGRVIGDIDDSIRTRTDITITPKIGGVGPMTITMLFENLLIATHPKTLE